ncbi:MAG: DedA family protein [Nocardioides sp.]|nr:DedA family protein [Nocardioides sp.]
MDAVLDWVVLVMRTVGSPGVGLATALETVFPPVPSELVLPLAGYTASQGHYGVVAAIAWATAGSLVGALVLYWLGAAWGLDRVCALADRIPLMHAQDVRRAVTWFGRHGRTAVFVGRLVPGVRSLISIPAGIDRMPLVRFCVFTTAGSLVWNAALILAGYELGAQWHVVERYVGGVGNVVLVLLAVALVVVVARRLRQRRAAA